jgi:hypothetical protein
MIDYETFIKIKTCHEQDGLSCRQIAHYLGLDYRNHRYRSPAACEVHIYDTDTIDRHYNS